MILRALLTTAPFFLFSLFTLGDSLYTKSSPVLQVDAKSYEKLIAQSNHTSIVEFYAPWCGHCQNLKPAYEKAAKSLKGLAKVAAVNCDDESNKPFCSSMGVKGFPTLKIVRPSKKVGRPVVEDYQGARSAKAIVDAVTEKIPNHVVRITDQNLDNWLKEGNETAKAILFTEKGTTSALLRALAIDFLGTISFAQIRDKERESVGRFGISEYPTLLLLPGGDKDAITFHGQLKKEAMMDFLSELFPPNLDPRPEMPKVGKKADKGAKMDEKSSKASSTLSEASASHKAAEESEAVKSSTTIDAEEPTRTDSPDSGEDKNTPVDVQDIPPALLSLETESSLQASCFRRKSHICLLLLLPATEDPETQLPEAATVALTSLGEIFQKHSARKAKMFPFYSVPSTNPLASDLRDSLGLKDAKHTEVIAVNAKKAWWKTYGSENFSKAAVETWIDEIRMGEGTRRDLPETLVKSESEEVDQTAPINENGEQLKDPLENETVQTTPNKHDEL